MAKPILVVRCTYQAIDRFDDIRDTAIASTNNEYHVLIAAHDDNAPRFEVFNVNKEPEIDYEQLKKQLKL